MSFKLPIGVATIYKIPVVFIKINVADYMILTTHALVGAAIGKNISNIWLIVILSTLSHFILDHFRHGEYLTRKKFNGAFRKTIVDLTAGLLIIGMIAYFLKFSPTEIRNIIIGSIFGMLPDALTLIYWKSKIKILAPLYRFHIWAHKYPMDSPQRQWNIRNAINEIIISAAAIGLLAIS